MRDPHAVLASLAATAAKYILVDRTPIVEGGDDRIVARQVPAAIYPGSYPCWIFARTRLLAALGDGWDVIAEDVSPHAPLHTDAGDVPWRSLFVRRAA